MKVTCTKDRTYGQLETIYNDRGEDTGCAQWVLKPNNECITQIFHEGAVLDELRTKIVAERHHAIAIDSGKYYECPHCGVTFNVPILGFNPNPGEKMFHQPLEESQ